MSRVCWWNPKTNPRLDCHHHNNKKFDCCYNPLTAPPTAATKLALATLIAATKTQIFSRPLLLQLGLFWMLVIPRISLVLVENQSCNFTTEFFTAVKSTKRNISHGCGCLSSLYPNFLRAFHQNFTIQNENVIGVYILNFHHNFRADMQIFIFILILSQLAISDFGFEADLIYFIWHTKDWIIL